MLLIQKFEALSCWYKKLNIFTQKEGYEFRPLLLTYKATFGGVSSRPEKIGGLITTSKTCLSDRIGHLVIVQT